MGIFRRKSNRPDAGAEQRKSVWERLLPPRMAAPPPPPETGPEQKTNYENLAETGRATGRALGGLWGALQGKRPPPPRTCQWGHPVLPGSTTCIKGHYVG